MVAPVPAEAHGDERGALLSFIAAQAEPNWLRLARRRPDERRRSEETWAEGFRLTGEETVPDVLAFRDGIVEEPEECARAVPSLDDTFPLPEAPWFPEGGRVSVRWPGLHPAQEFGRHAGTIRESLDGMTSLELIAMEAGREA